jgi:protein-tyrosine phosphatase
MGERGLGLIGAPNARDLGGLVTRDGQRLRSGLLYRAGALGRLSDQDVDALAALRLGYLIDLRDQSEIATAPADRLPAAHTPQVRHLPVFDPEHPVFTYVSAVLMGHDAAAVAEVESSPAAMDAIYRWMVADPKAHAGFGAALRTIADAAGAPVLFHCSAGKDRTGWLTAIILDVLGVDRDTIMADYLSTNDYSRATHAAIMDAMRARGRAVDPDRMLPVFEARAEYLRAALAEADRRYGGVAGYVRDALDVPADVLDAIRKAVLDGSSR